VGLQGVAKRDTLGFHFVLVGDVFGQSISGIFVAEEASSLAANEIYLAVAGEGGQFSNVGVVEDANHGMYLRIYSKMRARAARALLEY